MTTILIVANQTLSGDALRQAIEDRMAADHVCRFHVLVPIPPIPPSAIAVGLAAVESAASAMVDVPDQAEVARERLTAGLEWLREIGANVDGEVVADDVVDAVEAAVEAHGVDEIIVSTLPSRLSRWLRQDLPHQIGRRVEVPVAIVTPSD